MDNFHFKGFEPNDSLTTRAERAFDRILERAPSDAKITAIVEKNDEIFHCSIEIGSSSCPFIIETSHKVAAIALDKAELSLMRKLDKWRGHSYIPEDRAPLRAPLRVAN